MNPHTPPDQFLSELVREIYRYGLYDSSGWTPQAAQEFADEFEAYYEAGQWNLYSPTYAWLSEVNADAAEYIYERLQSIENILKSRNSKHLKDFSKFRDYISLEAARASDFDDVQKSADRAEEAIREIDDTRKAVLGEYQKLKEEIETDRKNANTQSITVLSIFTGIAMAFFGGFSLLGSAFSALTSNPWYVIMLISSVIGLILFNTVYGLLGIASRISGNPSTQPGHDNCLKCTLDDRCDKKHQKGFLKRWLRKFRRKYPYAFAINIILIAILAISLIICAISLFIPGPDTADITQEMLKEILHHY